MKITITVLWVCISIFAHAQNIKMATLASIEVKVSYEVDQLCDYPNQYRANDWREKSTLLLEIGKKITHSYIVEEHNKLIDQFIMFRNKNRWKLEPFNTHALLGETFIGYPNEKTLTQIVNLDAAGVFQYVEPIPKMKWNIFPEHKVIIGYNCQRATCSFRGRDYEAWFTSEIPLSYGPWKFQGLPGLILEVVDEKNEYHFIATGIKQENEMENITIFDEKISIIKRNKAQKMEAMLHKDHGAYAADYGINYRLGDGQEHNSQPYYPIELK